MLVRITLSKVVKFPTFCTK